MPKLKAPDLERNRRHIEDAALQVFIRQGFHGTTMRDIAEAAGVSMGNIYTYNKTKEDLYVSIIRSYEKRMVEIQKTTVWPLVGRLDTQGLALLAEAVRKVVYNDPDYWRLMYIDVVEFGNQHFAHSFRRLAKTLQKHLGTSLKERVNGDIRDGIDPALAVSSIYLQLFSYFLVEKLFGGKQHLGMPDHPAVAQMIQMFTVGLWPDGSRHRAK